MLTLYIPANYESEAFAERWTGTKHRHHYLHITPSSLARLLRHADLSTVTAHPTYGNVSVDIV